MKWMSLASVLRKFLPTVYEKYGALNARQYAYRAEAAGLVTKKQFKYVNSVLTRLREQNVIPWKAVLDSSREFQPYRVIDSEDPEDYIEYCKSRFKEFPDQFSLPRWQYQKVIPVIFTEKEGLIQYFEMVTKFRAVSIYAQKGQVGKSHLHEVVFPWMMRQAAKGKIMRMIYLGDCDDEGFQIPLTLLQIISKWAEGKPQFNIRDLFPRYPDRIEGKGSILTFERLVLKPEQVESMGLRKDPLNPRSTIAKKFVDFKCEVEAVEPSILRSIIEEAIDETWDEKAEEKRQQKTEEIKKPIKEKIEDLSKDW